MKIKRLVLILVVILSAVLLIACIGCKRIDNSDGVGDDVPTNSEIGSGTDSRICYGIGYGYNVIKDPYFSVGNVSKNSILDLSKMQKYIEKTMEGKSISGGIYAETLDEYSISYSNKLNLGIDISGGWSVFSAGVNAKFDLNQISKFSSTDKQVFYTYFDNISTYYYEMKNYNIDILRGMLSELFMSALNRETSETKYLSDEQLAEYLMDTFGTHLITGVQMGGRIEYSYLITTSNMEIYDKLSKTLSIKFSAGVKGIVDGNISTGKGSETEEILSSTDIQKSITIQRFGGEATGLWDEEELKANYTKWAESLNNEKYLNAVGIANDGMVALWALIPRETCYTGVIDALVDKYEREGLYAYNSTIEKYSPHLLISDNGEVIINLQDYYQYESASMSAYRKENYDPDTGIFKLYGNISGKAVSRYIIRGKYSVADSNGRIIRSIIDNLSFEIHSEHNIEIEFENMAFIAAADFPAVYSDDNIENKKITITLIMKGNSNILYGGDGLNFSDGQPAIKINVENLIIDVDADSEIYGGNGKSFDVNSYTGENGGIGGYGILLDGNLTLNVHDNITVRGGNGGNGSPGAQGNNGNNGKDATEDGWLWNNVNGGNGGSGDRGQDGGHGGSGGVALNAKKVIINYGNCTLIGGNGGRGGHAGDGGTGGVGGTHHANTGGADGHAGDGGAGGVGGSGGDGGYGASSLVVESLTIYNCDLKLISGNGGDGGDGGNGGNGGRGGNATKWGAYQAKAGGGGSSGDGGNGGNGGNIVRVACNIKYINSSVTQIDGIVGKGGAAGDCGQVGNHGSGRGSRTSGSEGKTGEVGVDGAIIG